ncbi:hypothetical protein [Mesorhizobium sp.]|uniref:hypothetical protein n=1 Tax=Mesorhizobium sp. TaxID=1871066 RepID=UPI000FE9BDEC|nr:hypothetical protein [Mesorhizobium sp.]RWP75837.1 MAG: hypothetical protein EOR09_12440 [Mesorhizobium sp.]
MLLLPNVGLSAAAIAKLAQWQAEVDSQLNYPAQVEAAKAKFKQQNTRQNGTFQAVKVALTSMCSGARRCVYCEDSVADEVEHMAPKDLYPDKVFGWGNYVYACGPCNGPKNNKFGVIDAAGALVDVTRKPRGPVVPPLVGLPALINPRVDNPSNFFDLDLLGTFVLDVKEHLLASDFVRAEFTRDVLDLNRDVLLKARANAYGSYRARLFEYRQKRNGHASAEELAALVAGLKAMPHPTVFSEMKRLHAAIPDLSPIFGSVPEALQW